MSDLHQKTLEELGLRLENQGFRFRVARYFAPSGILVFTPPVQRDSDSGIAVIERAVALYASADSWEARVTRHGGPHWTRQANTLAELEELALEALRATAIPPSPHWRSAET